MGDIYRSSLEFERTRQDELNHILGYMSESYGTPRTRGEQHPENKNGPGNHSQHGPARSYQPKLMRIVKDESFLEEHMM